MSKEAKKTRAALARNWTCAVYGLCVYNLSLLCCWSTPLIDLDNDARPASAACVDPNYYMKKKSKEEKKRNKKKKEEKMVSFALL